MKVVVYVRYLIINLNDKRYTSM